MNLYRQVETAILEPEPSRKCELVTQIRQDWKAGLLDSESSQPILPVDDPGRPRLPLLVKPRHLKRRTTASDEGRVCFLHAFAHIEFNAINIALDAVYRFRSLPEKFIHDWLLVASEEARHFSLLSDELVRRGAHYGAYEAHRGLWDMVCKTRGDVLHRMALVPRVMEAQGLDVTPGLMKKFAQVDDAAAVAILETIYRDEIGHVRIGNDWFQFLCEERGVDPDATFRRLIDRYLGGKLRGPFNRPARIEAGFRPAELDDLEQRVSPRPERRPV